MTGSDLLLGKDLFEVHVRMHAYISPTVTRLYP